MPPPAPPAQPHAICLRPRPHAAWPRRAGTCRAAASPAPSRGERRFFFVARQPHPHFESMRLFYFPRVLLPEFREFSLSCFFLQLYYFSHVFLLSFLEPTCLCRMPAVPHSPPTPTRWRGWTCQCL